MGEKISYIIKARQTTDPRGLSKGKVVCQLTVQGLRLSRKGETKGKAVIVVCNFKVSDLRSWGLLGLILFLRPVPLGQKR